MSAMEKLGVGRGRKKKNPNFLQMLSTVGKKTIPVRGTPNNQTTLGSKNTLKIRTNAWRQKKVKKVLFSPKNANKTSTGSIAASSIPTNLDSETIVVNKLPKLTKSYKILPPHYDPPICSGRTDLCNSVLNDEYVCVPPHSEELNSRIARKWKITNKTQMAANQIEEGRYEVDLMIEIGNYCIAHFESIVKKMSSMSQVMLNTFQLGELLGGSSQVIPSFIMQLYGKTVGPKMVAAINKKPYDSVPVLLPRIKGKVEEWREAQKSLNQKWRDQL